MQLSEGTITSFKKTYKKVFGREPKEEEVQEMALDLLKFIKMIYRPIPKKQEAYLLTLKN